MAFNNQQDLVRRKFLKQSLVLSGLTLFSKNLAFGGSFLNQKINVNAHLWVYASKFPPNWDSTPVLETVFSDLSYAGIEGLELMEINLRPDNAVANINNLIKKYNLPVSGTSYGDVEMWDAAQHQKIFADVSHIIKQLNKVGGKTLGISVGEAGRLKTEKELDAQANLLKKILSVCKEFNVEANLHNHTYEVENNLHDLKGTMARLPEIKLGPDLNWLIRAGVNPVEFIDRYGDKIVYLHIRDQYKNGEWTEYVGQGDTDFKAIADALQKINFKGNAAIELAFSQNFEPKNPLKEDWKISRDYVRTTFGW